jgi:hypothetical protein
LEFRDTQKDRFQILVPSGVHEEVGIMAVRLNRPINEVISALLCKGVNLNPADFGLEHSLTRRVRKVHQPANA